jgi:hypothetical protein
VISVAKLGIHMSEIRQTNGLAVTFATAPAPALWFSVHLKKKIKSRSALSGKRLSFSIITAHERRERTGHCRQLLHEQGTSSELMLHEVLFVS